MLPFRSGVYAGGPGPVGAGAPRWAGSTVGFVDVQGESCLKSGGVTGYGGGAVDLSGGSAQIVRNGSGFRPK